MVPQLCLTIPFSTGSFGVNNAQHPNYSRGTLPNRQIVAAHDDHDRAGSAARQGCHLQHYLALQGLPIQGTLAGEDDIGLGYSTGERRSLTHRREPAHHPRTDGEQAEPQTAGCARASDRCHIDSTTRRKQHRRPVSQVRLQNFHVTSRGTLLARIAIRRSGRTEERRGDIGSDHQIHIADPRQRNLNINSSDMPQAVTAPVQGNIVTVGIDSASA